MSMKHMIKKAIKYFLIFTIIVDFMPVLYDSDIVSATEDNTPSSTVYATKEELMNAFTPDENGVSNRFGKIAFGREADDEPIQWYILGRDSGVEGDNIMLFPIYGISPVMNRNGNTAIYKIDAESYTHYDANLDMGIYKVAPTKPLAPSHYGASDLRHTFRSMEESHFTATERALLNETTVKTYDVVNKIEYTTTEKLYALHADNYTDDYLYIGSTNNKMDLATYCSRGGGFWLRSSYGPSMTLLGQCYPRDHAHIYTMVDNNFSVRPATNVNISSVIFAAGAVNATSSGILAGRLYAIGDLKGYGDSPMYLRYDGKNKNIGEAWYNTALGIITAKKDKAAKGTVAVVIQGKNESKDWYYSKTITETEKVYTSDIIKALQDKVSMYSISLDDCKIWIETTEDGIAYAKSAIPVIPVDTVDITGVSEPVPMQKLDTVADTSSIEISDTSIIWTCNGVEVTGDAQYSTSYIANVTITLNNEYGFSSKVLAMLNGKKCEANVNQDGTVTMSYKFITKEKPSEATTVPQTETMENLSTENTTEETTTIRLSDTDNTKEPTTEEITTEEATEIEEAGAVTTDDDSEAKKNNNWCWIIWLVIFMLIIIVFIIIVILKKKNDDKTTEDNEENSIK